MASLLDVFYLWTLALTGFAGTLIGVVVMTVAARSRVTGRPPAGLRAGLAIESAWSAIPLAAGLGIFLWSSWMLLQGSRV